MDPENTETIDTEVETTTETNDEPKESLESAVNDAIEQETVAPKEKDEATGETSTAEAEAKAGEAAQSPEEKAAADKAVADAAAKGKAPDPVNDPIPKNLHPKTQERMQSLVTKIKEMTPKVEQLEKVTAERDEILGYIVDTKSTPEQYTQALGYLKAVNSGDPVQIKAAIQTVQAELRALSAQIGEPVAGVDLLGEHQDLQDAVSTGVLTREYAEELAAARTNRATREAQSTHAAAQTKQDREAEAALNDGKASLNALEAALKADPHYAAKREQLIPKLQAEFAKLHPSRWASRWAEEYAKIPNPTATVVPIAKAQNQPLRPRQPAGGTSKAATSLEDAINQGIEEASGR